VAILTQLFMDGPLARRAHSLTFKRMSPLAKRFGRGEPATKAGGVEIACVTYIILFT
jgi:hypothetical protein